MMTQDTSKAELHPPQEGRVSRRRPSPKKLSKSVLFVGAVLFLLIVSIPVYGYYKVYIAPLREQILRVNDKVFTVGDYVEKLRYLEAENQIYGEKLDYSTDLFKLLDNMRDDEVLRRIAPTLGITVTDEDITKALRERVGATPKEGEEVTESELNRRFQELYKQRLTQINLSDSKYRDIIKGLVVREKVKDYLNVRIPAVTEQVEVSGIKAADEDAARKLKERAEKGEDFGVLARQNSTDTESKDNLGDLGWIPRHVMEDSFDAIAFDLPAGKISDPFYMQNGVWIITVVKHDPARPVEGQAKERLRNRALEEWLKEQVAGMDIQRRFDSDLYEFVLNKLKEYRIITPTPTPQGP